jgi:hypothetical protein
MEWLFWVYYNTRTANDPTDNNKMAAIAYGKVRENISGIMGNYAKSSGKQYWCEKSVLTADSVNGVLSVFPDAKFICLYRNCLDQVRSALETLSFHPTGKDFGFEPFLKSSPDNKVNGLIDYWHSKTQTIHQFESSHPYRCLRVTYEELVLDSNKCISKIFKYLGHPVGREIIENIFSSKHIAGPGDGKIHNTNSIHAKSVGKGNELNVQDISPSRLKKINPLLQIIGYDIIRT